MHFIGSKYTKNAFATGLASDTTGETPHGAPSLSWRPLIGGEAKERIRKGGREGKGRYMEGEERELAPKGWAVYPP